MVNSKFFSYSSLKFNLHNQKVSFLCPKFFVSRSALRTRSVYPTLIQSPPMPSQTGPLTMHRVLSPDCLTLVLPIFFCEVYARVRTCPEVSEWLSCPSGHSYLSLGQFMPYVQSIVILCPSRKSRLYFLPDFLSFFDLLNFPLFFRPIKVDFYTLCCIKLYHPTVNDNFNSIVVRFQ